MTLNGSVMHGLCEETYVLRLVGEIRYTTIAGLEHSLDEMLASRTFSAATVDLRAARSIDSTALGLLARIGNFVLRHRGRRAVVVCAAGEIEDLLRAVGFDEVFEITHELPLENECLMREIPQAKPSERGIGRLVLEAHRELMQVSPVNRETFAAVVEQLQRELDRKERP